MTYKRGQTVALATALFFIVSAAYEFATTMPATGQAAKIHGTGYKPAPGSLSCWYTDWTNSDLRCTPMDLSAHPFGGLSVDHEAFVRRYGYDSRIFSQAHFRSDGGHLPTIGPQLVAECRADNFGTATTHTCEYTWEEFFDYAATHGRPRSVPPPRPTPAPAPTTTSTPPPEPTPVAAPDSEPTPEPVATPTPIISEAERACRRQGRCWNQLGMCDVCEASPTPTPRPTSTPPRPQPTATPLAPAPTPAATPCIERACPECPQCPVAQPTPVRVVMPIEHRQTLLAAPYWPQPLNRKRKARLDAASDWVKAHPGEWYLFAPQDVSSGRTSQTLGPCTPIGGLKGWWDCGGDVVMEAAAP